MKQLVPGRIAELLFALTMLIFGALHLKYAEGYKMGVPSFIPGPAIMWIYITGIGFVLAAVAIFINKYKRLACYLLAVMILVFVITIHLQPEPLRMGKYDQPLKDIALAMAAILIGNSAKS
ncbi:MAG: DoxX family protein [Bacteroidetes bacterium]|nr:DoxX family protein [Bacteroidota bacterium]